MKKLDEWEAEVMSSHLFDAQAQGKAKHAFALLRDGLGMLNSMGHPFQIELPAPAPEVESENEAELDLSSKKEVKSHGKK